MAEKIFGLARATCSAKCMIRANWSLVGGLKVKLSPTQAKAFQVARRHTPVAQMSFASQLPLASQRKGGGFDCQEILIQANSERTRILLRKQVKLKNEQSRIGPPA